MARASPVPMTTVDDYDDNDPDSMDEGKKVSYDVADLMMIIIIII